MFMGFESNTRKRVFHNIEKFVLIFEMGVTKLEVKRVFWIEAFHKLSLVIAIDKELNVSGERLQSSGETSRLAS